MSFIYAARPRDVEQRLDLEHSDRPPSASTKRVHQERVRGEALIRGEAACEGARTPGSWQRADAALSRAAARERNMMRAIVLAGPSKKV